MTDRVALRDRVFATIAEFFQQPLSSITERTTAPDVPGWDSVSHVALLVQLEEVLGLEFDIERIGGLLDVGDFIDECVRLSEAT